jgi:hypothetical protein
VEALEILVVVALVEWVSGLLPVLQGGFGKLVIRYVLA